MSDLYIGALTGFCANLIATRVVYGRYVSPTWWPSWDWLSLFVLLVTLVAIGRL